MQGTARSSAIDVAVAVIRDDAGRILITRRHAHQAHGDKWEFPGGKTEPGEDPHTALIREIDEELGLAVTRCSPWKRIAHAYPEQEVILHVWNVDAYIGSPDCRAAQEFRWVPPSDLYHYEFPEADRSLVNALSLPDIYCITPAVAPDATAVDDFLNRLEALLQSGIRLVQLRSKQLAEREYRRLAGRTLDLCHRYHARLLCNAAPELALAIGADGVHLDSRRLASLSQRPRPAPFLVAASCHDIQELRQAEALECDFAVLSPVRPSSSHPQTPALGWDSFGELASAVDLPVYALGGLQRVDLGTARQMHGQGIAMISGLWGSDI